MNDTCNKSSLHIRLNAENQFSVVYNEKPIGGVELYSNRFHSQSQYLRLHLSRYENRWAQPLFSQIQKTVKKPLQVMVSSTDTEVVRFLTAGGFVCKRRCYELEVTSEAGSFSDTMPDIKTAEQGQLEYRMCCELLYAYYKKTHCAVNPLTADLAAFCENLPEDVFFEIVKGQILHCAFVEDNEIAYVATSDVANIRSFAQAVAEKLFAEHETICFECDSCDAAAMALKGLFRVEMQESYDTYVLDIS